MYVLRVTPFDSSQVQNSEHNDLVFSFHQCSSVFICVYLWIHSFVVLSVFICVHPWFQSHL